MITLLIGFSVIAGVGLGWYGHKAVLRINRWGQNANACDDIFRAATAGEDNRDSAKAWVLDTTPATPRLRNPRLTVGVHAPR